jgi:uncharacterized membrane protein
LLNHHFVEIKAPLEKIFEEIVLWGESSWWPEESPMKYSREGKGEVKVGTIFHQKVDRPFAPEWGVEVTAIVPGREVSRKFINGMFRGTDRVYIIPNRGFNEVHFLMDYEVAGMLNRILWTRIYRRMHDDNIKLILRSLKASLEGAEVSKREDRLSPEEEDRRRFFKSFVRRH